MSKMLSYAGIGSRTTPAHILQLMNQIGYELANLGWNLRSGHAIGADQAFEQGCIEAVGKKQIYLPWLGFNDAPRDHPDYIRPKVTQEVMEISAQFHPNWIKCTEPAKLLHARNLYQITGHLEGSEPSVCVICWTPCNNLGGTGQAIRIANHLGIPVFNLAGEDTLDHLTQFVQSMM